MRVGLIGYGKVGAIHARALRGLDHAELAVVFGPSLMKARAFAANSQIPEATDDFEQFTRSVDTALVCSPSPQHFVQAKACLEAGKHVLVELPPCASPSEAESLWESALKTRCTLQCAHTSRYLPCYVQLGSLIRKGTLGNAHQIVYLRHFSAANRSWTDDALLHHMAHPVDLLLDWFGELIPVACLAVPKDGPAESASTLWKLPGEAQAVLAISYHSRLPRSSMTVIGGTHTVETDGFTFLKSDLNELEQVLDYTDSYAAAVKEQDAQFLRACTGVSAGVPWADTLSLMRTLEKLECLRRDGL